MELLGPHGGTLLIAEQVQPGIAVTAEIQRREVDSCHRASSLISRCSAAMGYVGVCRGTPPHQLSEAMITQGSTSRLMRPCASTGGRRLRRPKTKIPPRNIPK